MRWLVMPRPCLPCPVHAPVMEKHDPVMTGGGVWRMVMMPSGGGGMERLDSVRAMRLLIPRDGMA